MWIRMLTCAAGPDGVWFPGAVREVDDAVGRGLIAGRFAVELDSSETRRSDQPEAAVVAPREDRRLSASGRPRARVQE